MRVPVSLGSDHILSTLCELKREEGPGAFSCHCCETEGSTFTACCLTAKLCQRHRRRQPTLQMPLQPLNREPPQIGRPSARPLLASKNGNGLPKDPQRKRERLRRKRRAGQPLVLDANQPIRVRMPVCRTPGERLPANGAV